MGRLRFWTILVVSCLAISAAAVAGLAGPTPAGEARQVRPAQDPAYVTPKFACMLPLVMGDVAGRWTVEPDPANDINSVDAMFILARIARLPLPDGGGGCSPLDIDCDLDWDAVDALWILRWVADLPVYQVEPCPDIGTEL